MPDKREVPIGEAMRGRTPQANRAKSKASSIRFGDGLETLTGLGTLTGQVSVKRIYLRWHRRLSRSDLAARHLEFFFLPVPYQRRLDGQHGCVPANNEKLPADNERCLTTTKDNNVNDPPASIQVRRQPSPSGEQRKTLLPSIENLPPSIEKPSAEHRHTFWPSVSNSGTFVGRPSTLF